MSHERLRQRLPDIAAKLLELSAFAKPDKREENASFLAEVCSQPSVLDGYSAHRISMLVAVYARDMLADPLTDEQLDGLWDATAWALEYRLSFRSKAVGQMVGRAIELIPVLRTEESRARAMRELSRLATHLSAARRERVERALADLPSAGGAAPPETIEPVAATASAPAAAIRETIEPVAATASAPAAAIREATEAVPATVLDRLIAKVVQDESATIDDLLEEASDKLQLRRLQAEGPAAYLRALRPGPDGDLMASTVLRLIAGRYDTIDRSDYRSQIVAFVDGQYSQRLKAYYQPPRNRSAYEVLSALAPVAPALEQRAQEIVAAMRDLHRLESLRQELMRLLNSDAGQVIFRPFLPLELLGHELPAVFDGALDVRDAENRDAVDTAYRRVCAHVDGIEGALEAQPTQYGDRVVLGAAAAVREACKRRSELKGPPARLEFRASDRPLPLLEPGVSCSAGLTVTNEGEAAAADVELSFSTPDGTVALVDEAPARLGRMEPRSRKDISVALLVGGSSVNDERSVNVRLGVSANWTNLDHTIGHADADLSLRAQEALIDWEQFEPEKLFAPYPVEEAEQLVGRGRQLATLHNHFASQPLANLYVTGQRRVGKTSLVRVLEKQLGDVPKLLVASVEMGEARGGGLSTIGALGRKLAQRTLRQVGLGHDDISMPVFAESLAPLADVLEQLLELDDGLSFLFVIDEFDQLPHETYRRDGPGEALFLPMRSLAQKPNVGWLLVGGETMPFIRDEQAAQLNTFREISLDYLPSLGAGEGRGFGELVRGPLPAGFAVDDAAVREIHEQSAGNPHFAKEICAAVFALADSRRDAVVTAVEVEEAVESAAREGAIELFAHFWGDGVFGVEEERRRQELHRREYLTACAETLRSTSGLPQGRVRQSAAQRGLDAADIERLRAEFVRRGILRERDGQRLQVHVPFFQRWLETEGIYKLPPKGIAEQFGRQLAAADERLRISDDEIRRLARRWEEFKFRGERITRDRIETWLGQFDLPLQRRLAFRLLERLRLINAAQVNDGFQRLQRLVAHESQIRLKPGQKALTHVYVSALGGPGSSGESFVYTYRQANSISGSNVVQPSHLAERLTARHEINTVILVDDFIGSGGTASKAMAALAGHAHELRARPPVNWFLFAVTGLPEGVRAVAESEASASLGLRVELAHALTEASLPFSADSSVFPDPDEREEARQMVLKYGERIGAGGHWDMATRRHPSSSPRTARITRRRSYGRTPETGDRCSCVPAGNH